MPDTAYIQARANDGALIADGTYTISSRITITVGLNGTSRAGTIINTSAAIATSAFAVQGDCYIKNLTINGSPCGTIVAISAALKSLLVQNVAFTGSLTSTTYHIDLNGITAPGEDIIIENCTFSGSGGYLIRLRDNIRRARISDCTLQQWLHYAILVRAGDNIGPKEVTIDSNTISNPIAGLAGARQMIVAIGDPETPQSNILYLKVLNNVCTGTGEFFDATSLTTRGSGDQIVLHRCTNFEVIGNTSNLGGENGISVTQYNHWGVVNNNTCNNNDADGIQISKLNTRSTHILCANNTMIDNCGRLDGAADTLSGLFIQDGENIQVYNNIITETRAVRKMKNGIQIGSSRDVLGGRNVITFTDTVGANYVLISASTDTWVWHNE